MPRLLRVRILLVVSLSLLAVYFGLGARGVRTKEDNGDGPQRKGTFAGKTEEHFVRDFDPVARNATAAAAPPPPILCDSECLRFKELLQNWPAGKPKAAIYYLAHRYHLLKQSLILLEQNFISRFNYPIIVFIEADFLSRKENISQVAPGVFFQEVQFKTPEWVKPIPKFKCSAGIGYKHMCRFHSKQIYEHPIMEGLEYYWRLDDDSSIQKPIKYDLFEFMRERHLEYGYWKITQAYEPCVYRLWDGAEKFLAQSDIKPQFFHQWPKSSLYYNNFEIASMAMWNSDGYKQYIDFIDKLGGIYFYRWGDAPIKSIAVTIFLPQSKTHKFSDIKYVHSTKLTLSGL